MDFKAEFNKNAVLDFLKNEFLPDNFETLNEPISLSQLSFKPEKIKEIEYIGQSPELDLKLFVVRHDSENDPRVTISRETFRVMSSLSAGRALVIFHSNASANWRLSLATISLELKGAKTKREYSNPRRYSFSLGPDAHTHTPEEFLQKKGRLKDFDDLHKRFSIEVVNEEFYRDIAEKFTELVGGKRKLKNRVEEFKPVLKLPDLDHFKPAGHTTAQEFAVRLIGRIVFCWFLKKKKPATGEPLLSDDILSTAAVAKCEKNGDNYYHTVLENLFFQTLNTEMSERAKPFKKAPYSQVPFLNGGLFEANGDENSGDYYKYNPVTNCSVNINSVKIPNEWFTGLITILETYNFTIDENTSVDIELAVDPEMLGRIFENLLAEINPETGETARKSTGSFYTPRHIVEYMVDESLKEYLKTKTTIPEEKLLDLLSYADDADLTDIQQEQVISALDGIKIIDPACGSGAFPMGMLQKIVLILQKVDPESEKWLDKQVERIPDAMLRKETLKQLRTKSINYIRKMGVLRDCIYGVDIQETAAEISKLRFFLSLIIDETVNDASDNRGIEHLPNLEFKFVCANTLVALAEERKIEIPDLFDANINIHDRKNTGNTESDIEELKLLREEYFSSSGARKRNLRKKFEAIQEKLYLAAIKSKETSKTLSLSTWKPFKNEVSPWFDPDWMFGVKNGFDIVITNPPFVSHDKIAFIDNLRLNYQSFEPFADLYCYFLEFALKVLRPRGILCYITSNSYLRASYGSSLRRMLSIKSNIHNLINMEDSQLFDSAIVNTAIIIAKLKSEPDSESQCVVVNASLENSDDFMGFIKKNAFYYDQKEFVNKSWGLLPVALNKLRNKIERAGDTLEQLGAKIRLGLATGSNDAFVIDEEVKKRLVKLDKRNAEIIKPVLRGRDIQRYVHDAPSLYILLTKNGVDVKNDYPTIYEYLSQFGARFKNRGAQGQHWTNLRACAFFDDFKKDKIIWIELADKGRFSLCSEEIYLLNSAYLLLPPETIGIKHLIALLNSRVIQFYLTITAETSGMGTCRWINNHVKDFPVPKTLRDNTEILRLVDKILTSKNQTPAIDVSGLEREIDQYIYQLYSLTPQEINIIEGEE